MAAKKGAKAPKDATSGQSLVSYWQEQIAKQQKAYSEFYAGGERIIDRYRIEKANAQQQSFQDRYNMLYSSTETMRPSLYAQTPKCEVKKRHQDRPNPLVSMACDLIESTISYAIEEVDFDEVLENVIEDYMLPGLGVAWVRYEAKFKAQKDSAGNTVNDEATGEPAKVIDNELLHLDYKSWKDVLFGPCRTWKELPWAAKREYMDKESVTARFGEDVANRLQYTDQDPKKGNNDRNPVVADKQAVVWEIWDKRTREVIWISDGYDDTLDKKADPLRLKNFWPFPKPMRAISNTRTFVPRPFYSQYQSQAEELDNITARIRHLTNALNVRGVFDGSVNQLQALLAPNGGNKMIAVENWHQFIGQSGVNGAIQWVPIEMIVKVLMELYKARDAAKNEIYEITGFSDITRGLSKASETLGAQEIKQDWAGGRLKIMQKEVQRFCRDIVRIMAEIACEHFTDETFALYSGFDLPPPQPDQPALPAPDQQPPQAALPPPQAPGQPPAPPGAPMPPQGAPMGAQMMPPPLTPAQIALQTFKATLKMLREERERCANIGIETDSTILPDEEGERKDRLEFLGQIGAFLQQAAPTVQQFPQMAGLLGAMMMFSVRSFRAARPIEDEFAKFQSALEANPPPPQQNDNGQAAAQASVQVAQIKEEGANQRHATELQVKAQQVSGDQQIKSQQNQITMAQLQIQLRTAEVTLQTKQAELALKQAELQLKASGQASDTALAVNDQQHNHALDTGKAIQEAYEFDADGQRQDGQFQRTQDQQAHQFDRTQTWAEKRANQQESSPGG